MIELIKQLAAWLIIAGSSVMFAFCLVQLYLLIPDLKADYKAGKYSLSRIKETFHWPWEDVRNDSDDTIDPSTN